jgi:hypothetical protein
MLRELDKDRLVFESKTPLSDFRKNTKIEFKFSVQSVKTHIITFSAYVYEVANRYIITSIPDYLYKNLSRSYSRVQQTPEMNMVIRKDGFYYDLNYEKINVVDSFALDNFVLQLDENNVNTFIDENIHWLEQKTDGHKLILFKENIPATIEEKAVSKMGKILFISMPDNGLVSEKGNPGEKFFTEDSLYQFLIGNGENPESARAKIAGLFQQRTNQNICSDCYVPIIFLSYIIGYVHVWVNEGNPPITLDLIEKFRLFAKMIAFSLERDNYFQDGKKKTPAFRPKLLDISAGGFLFVLDHNVETITYAVGDSFSVQITISTRVIRCKASIVRNHFDRTHAYYGCKFENLEIEDTRFLFETIYGKPFTDKDLEFITGAV